MGTVAIIPVRGGSKSIPLKNIKLINGRPLVYWVIEAAINCKWIDNVYVSTDSDDIRRCVANYDKNDFGKLACIERDISTATDSASTESVLLDFVKRVKSKHIILLQATSPLTEAKHLDEAFTHFFEGGFDSLLSAVTQKRFIWKRNVENGTVVPVNYSPSSRPRRQESDGFLVENGAFYITKTDELLKSKVRISGKIGLYEMPEETYFEIDEPNDWVIVESLLNRRKAVNNLSQQLIKIKLFATDCDGVLTDSGMYYSSEGDWLKKFNTKDGMGFSKLREKGIITAILTGENSKIVEQRARKLEIDELFLGCTDKVKAMEEILKKYNLEFDEVAYIGDDINDMALLKKVGISFAVNDAMDSVKEVVDIVTSKKGGDGAVREAIDYVLSIRGVD